MPWEERFVRAFHALHLQRHHEPDRPLHEIYQVSTVNALLEGVLDGQMTYGELYQHGDFGLGTFNALDGEMVAFDGAFWQVKPDGKVQPVAENQQFPFATVLFFNANYQKTLAAPMDLAALEAHINEAIKSPNLFYAVRVDGTFERVRTRTIKRQSEPYPSLLDVAANQVEFELTDVEGTLVGFRFPDFAAGLNLPGYHLHFLTSDHQAGGHVLALELAHGQLAVDDTSSIHVELPTDAAFLAARLDGDRRDDLDKAER